MFWTTSFRPGHSPPQVTTAAVTCTFHSICIPVRIWHLHPQMEATHRGSSIRSDSQASQMLTVFGSK